MRLRIQLKPCECTLQASAPRCSVGAMGFDSSLTFSQARSLHGDDNSWRPLPQWATFDAGG